MALPCGYYAQTSIGKTLKILLSETVSQKIVPYNIGESFQD